MSFHCAASTQCNWRLHSWQEKQATKTFGVVSYIADKVAVMHNGRIEEQGDCLQVLQRPQGAYTRFLLAAVPRLQRIGAT